MWLAAGKLAPVASICMAHKAKRESLGFPVGVVLTSVLSVAAKGALPCSSVSLHACNPLQCVVSLSACYFLLSLFFIASVLLYLLVLIIC